MGRQVLFHMVSEDRAAFLDFVQKRDPVVIVKFTHPSEAEPEPLDFRRPESGSKDWLCLWNRKLLPSLRREYIAESNIGPYYRIDSSLPILEFSMPTASVWDGKPALSRDAFTHTHMEVNPASKPGMRGYSGG